MRRRPLPITISTLAIAVSLAASPALAVDSEPRERTIYRCLRDGTVSLSTAPEPGSRCEPRTIRDEPGKAPNLWGELGTVRGTLYEREQDGKTVYGTRKLPGSRPLLRFTQQTPEAPPASPAHAGLGRIGPPQLGPHAALFRAAARRHRIDDAWLRAIAHAESGFDRLAISPKGALGVMQLMPETIARLGLTDAMDPAQSIDAGARHLAMLLRQHKGDLTLAAAAYNAGSGAVARYGGVPPYAETREYVAKVALLHARYREAMKLPPLNAPLRVAQ
ncbi:MAG: lytic transglycosylase domain-containing protein [Pseudoxanthomonas suwonensis]|nr:lytic transglycosylase domain-containing protein [Pseudoxanthomonas suwonensis]